MQSKVLSVGWELMTIEAAVTGARILVDGIAHQQLGSEHDGRAAPEAVSAMLSMVSVRLRELWHVVQGTKNPAEIWAHHNATVKHAAHEHDDIYMSEWSPKLLLAQAEAEVSRARAASAKRKPRRKGKR